MSRSVLASGAGPAVEAVTNQRVKELSTQDKSQDIRGGGAVRVSDKEFEQVFFTAVAQSELG